ncbi:unnamed protein product [Chrysodeixis includens]|uniref:Uncharacterized protein n=1 Tax=Chrysodeixis includens TaxID=689277 RepID=A0A9N8L079_CHRIL|nr:unnamed protein product [Chrysodeixis includens]
MQSFVSNSSNSYLSSVTFLKYILCLLFHVRLSVPEAMFPVLEDIISKRLSPLNLCYNVFSSPNRSSSSSCPYPILLGVGAMRSILLYYEFYHLRIAQQCNIFL